jgi:putative endonuclease
MLNWFKKSPQGIVKSKTLGQLGEELAQAEYKKLGFTILAKNEYNKTGKRLGEIDFIAKNHQKLVFVEVKTRQSQQGKFGSALESVNQFKQIKLLKAVKVYLQTHKELLVLAPQIDVCVVILSEVDSIKSTRVGSAKRLFGGVDETSESVKIYSSVVEDWN